MAVSSFVCPECGKGFDTPRQLRGHRIAHKRRPRPAPAQPIPARALKNAAEATEVVKAFCDKMNPGLPFSPTGAVLDKGLWMVKVNWGFLPMLFLVSNAGEILRYYREPRTSPEILP